MSGMTVGLGRREMTGRGALGDCGWILTDSPGNRLGNPSSSFPEDKKRMGVETEDITA